METSKRGVGRPKATPQTGPLVLSERRARMKIEIEIGADAGEELAAYVRWVELSEGMSTADARAATVEFALRNVFKRDRMWQQRRRREQPDDRERSASPPIPHRAAPAAAPSPSLAPPSGHASSGTSTASR